MNKKTLLIVYKERDEEFFTHLKGLIDAKDDIDTGIIGVEDGSVRVFKCSESQWLTHKANGRTDKLADKILFIDDIQGITLSNYSFNQYGISYGIIDQRHYALIVDENYPWDELEYTDFQLELKRLVKDVEVTNIDAFKRKELANKNIKDNIPFAALGGFLPLAGIAAGILYAKDIGEAKKNAIALRKQMLYFAITKVYLEELDRFMKR